MAIEQKKVKVNGQEYLLHQFGGIKGFKLGKKVAKIILPAMGSFYSAEEEGAGGVFETLADKLDELDDQTVLELLSSVTYQNMEINFDEHFAGNYGTLILLLWEVCMFNFESLFTLATGDINQKD